MPFLSFSKFEKISCKIFSFINSFLSIQALINSIYSILQDLSVSIILKSSINSFSLISLPSSWNNFLIPVTNSLVSIIPLLSLSNFKNKQDAILIIYSFEFLLIK